MIGIGRGREFRIKIDGAFGLRGLDVVDFRCTVAEIYEVYCTLYHPWWGVFKNR